MKKLISFIALLFFASFTFAETWKVTSLEWPPYSGKALPGGGTSVIKLREALAKQNITLEVEFYPWARAKEYAKKPGYLGFFPAWPEEAVDGFTPSAGVDSSRVGVLSSTAKNFSWSSVDALFSGKKVGLVNSYVYPAEIEAAKKTYPRSIDQSPDEMVLMKKLSSGRIDAALTDPAVMLYLAQQNKVSNIVIVKKTLEEKPLVVAVWNSAEHKQRLEQLNQLLAH